jgi:hypothetical protein
MIDFKYFKDSELADVLKKYFGAGDASFSFLDTESQLNVASQRWKLKEAVFFA